MRRQCCCCAIIVLFSIYVAFLKFNSIDAGCAESKQTEEQPAGPDRSQWRRYCNQWAQQGCNGREVRPCIISPATLGCVAATINDVPDLTHNDKWDAFCRNNQQGVECGQKLIKPCFWHTNSRRESACIAKPERDIFV
ncbi:hypothetical protein niasHS_016091 [Heterodera schachtii]|uniref:Secreted protein n=1 Tax=Heterodera schachtii TaxID=97005 RepID=A0ABD2HQN3_HETSC